MKKILFKKLLIDCLKFFLLTALGISSIVWVFQAVNYMDIMVEDGRNYLVYLKFTLLSFPKIISKISPFALFLSFYYVLAKYEENNELIIFWSHGISKIQVINFFLKFSVLIMLVQILFMALVVPKSQDLAKSIIKDSNINFFDNFLKPKKFNDIIKGVTIYSESKSEDGKLKNIYIKKVSKRFRNNSWVDDFEITYAKSGIIKKFENTQVLVLYDGENVKGKGDKLDSFRFSKSDFNLSMLEPNTSTYKKIQENSSADLFKCYKSLTDKSSKTIKPYLVENCRISSLPSILGELYKRIIIPFYTPILILISLFLILLPKENINYFKFKIYIFLLGLFVIIFSETSIRFIDGVFLTNIKIIFIPFFLMLVIYLSIFYKFYFNHRKL